jgi:hypothetical protein
MAVVFTNCFRFLLSLIRKKNQIIIVVAAQKVNAEKFAYEASIEEMSANQMYLDFVFKYPFIKKAMVRITIVIEMAYPLHKPKKSSRYGFTNNKVAGRKK